MVTNKRKKVTKYRAHTTHGGGHRKKRRGAGSRGGRGNAGTGKRAGQKVAGISRKLGSKGFTSKNVLPSNSINVSYFTVERLEKLLSAKKITKEGDMYLVDLNKLGYTKILGTGNLKSKLKVVVDKFTNSAEEKVKAAGGEIVPSVAKATPKAE